MRVWGDFNIFLVTKTLYLLWQSVNFFPLIFEIDVYLRHMKFFRLISLAVAFIWNLIYFLVVALFWYQIYNPPQWRQYDFFFSFSICLVAFNLLFDWLAVPLNTMIIIKELSMEFF